MKKMMRMKLKMEKLLEPFMKEKYPDRESGCSFREYTAEEIRLATDNFSDRLRLKSDGDLTNVYRGRINHFTVAIQMLNSVHGLSSQDFQAKVKLLSDIRQPHVLAMVGFCIEPQCSL